MPSVPQTGPRPGPGPTRENGPALRVDPRPVCDVSPPEGPGIAATGSTGRPNAALGLPARAGGRPGSAAQTREPAGGLVLGHGLVLLLLPVLPLARRAGTGLAPQPVSCRWSQPPHSDGHRPGTAFQPRRPVASRSSSVHGHHTRCGQGAGCSAGGRAARSERLVAIARHRSHHLRGRLAPRASIPGGPGGGGGVAVTLPGRARVPCRHPAPRGRRSAPPCRDRP